jgi:uncharacterized membrane protein
MSRRALVIALLVSLAVNLFVLGGLAGATLMGFGWRRPHEPPPPGRLAAVGQALSPEHRDGWRAAMRTAVQTAGPQLRQARDLRRQAWEQLARDPAQPQAALTALDQSRALEGQARAIMDRAVVDYAAALPAPERAKAAQALDRRGPRPPRGGPWSGGGAGPDQPGLPDRPPPPER